MAILTLETHLEEMQRKIEETRQRTPPLEYDSLEFNIFREQIRKHETLDQEIIREKIKTDSEWQRITMRTLNLEEQIRELKKDPRKEPITETKYKLKVAHLIPEFDYSQEHFFLLGQGIGITNLPGIQSFEVEGLNVLYFDRTPLYSYGDRNFISALIFGSKLVSKKDIEKQTKKQITESIEEKLDSVLRWVNGSDFFDCYNFSLRPARIVPKPFKYSSTPFEYPSIHSTLLRKNYEKLSKALKRVEITQEKLSKYILRTNIKNEFFPMVFTFNPGALDYLKAISDWSHLLKGLDERRLKPLFGISQYEFEKARKNYPKLTNPVLHLVGSCEITEYTEEIDPLQKYPEVYWELENLKREDLVEEIKFQLNLVNPDLKRREQFLLGTTRYKEVFGMAPPDYQTIKKALQKIHRLGNDSSLTFIEPSDFLGKMPRAVILSYKDAVESRLFKSFEIGILREKSKKVIDPVLVGYYEGFPYPICYWK